MAFTSSLHTIIEHVEPDECLEPVSGVEHKHQTSLTLKRLQAPKRRTTGPQDPTSTSPPDPADRPVLHTISEHVEPDEFLEPVSGVERKRKSSLTLKQLQAPKRRTTGPTAEDPMSTSASDPADRPVLRTSKVCFQPATLVFLQQHNHHSFNTPNRSCYMKISLIFTHSQRKVFVVHPSITAGFKLP